MQTTEINFAPLLTSGTILGLGLGGLLDGIFPTPYLREWQEAWAICTWLISLAGLILMWNSLTNPYTPRSGKSIFGSFLVGWGLHLLLSNSILHLIAKGWQGQWIPEAILMILGALMMVNGKVIVTRAKRNFYAELVKNSQDKDLFARPVCPTPFSDSTSPLH